MDSISVAPPARPDSRETRALELFRAHGRQIERIAPDVYLVPSCTGEHIYRVNLADETCNCPDACRHPDLNCKHLLAVCVKMAKRRGATARRLGALEDRYEHEDLAPDERLELLDEVRALRRKLGL